jgi:mevalonate kinase
MAQEFSRVYPSKLILFGEHTVIYGSDLVCMPYGDKYIKIVEAPNENYKALQEFHQYLLKHPKLSHRFDFEGVTAFYQSFSLSSNIPIGYGLGSSGALTALYYDLFFEKSAALIDKKEDLAEIECFFHGKSSGIDPLVSYLNTSLHVRGQEINPISFELPFALTLFDSGIARKGQQAISCFESYSQIDRLKNDRLLRVYIPRLNEVIIKMIQGEIDWEKIDWLSRFQYYNFGFLVPKDVKSVWQDGWKSQEFMKLCGAGNGGFYLILKTLDRHLGV